MTIDIDSLQTFTPAQLLALVDHAIATLLAGGQSYSINGRAYNRADLDKLRQMRTDLKREVEETASTTGTLTALATFGRAR